MLRRGLREREKEEGRHDPLGCAGHGGVCEPALLVEAEGHVVRGLGREVGVQVPDAQQRVAMPQVRE